ncbi:MAG: hypothetical protein A2Y97_08745 [Nitrospirae bacterium RBG_13_39_12]|nr:MAG: hypothetical protein A2Y97_08745 [Nitrospirae bacterium RBG_13_39_12]
MIKREDGYSLVELMITMVIFVLFIASATSVFTGLLTQFKQQSRIAETSIEGLVGLELLRQDIEHAGYGLPWNGLIAYSESGSNPFSLNDATGSAPYLAPRAIVSENNATFAAPNNIFSNSDYLVIKSVSVARNDASSKSTILKAPDPATFPDTFNPRVWGSSGEDLADTNRVIVISPGTADANARTLITSGANFYTTLGSIKTTPAGWAPGADLPSNLVYGINTSSADTPKRPFNRADYSIRIPASMPDRCAPGTGILYKATMDHDATGTFSYLPLLDCVLDFQVVYCIDIDSDGDCSVGFAGSTDRYMDDIKTVGYVAEDIRSKVSEVRVYILSHEGQIDPRFQYDNFDGSCGTCVLVGEIGLAALGHNVDLSTITNYQRYRWKLYKMVVKPTNLGS